MANSSLQGKSFKLDDDIKNHLKKMFNAYKGEKTKEGYQRLRNLIDSDSITYEELKRIKNFFDSHDGGIKETSYRLNGGSKMKSWIEKTLSHAREDLTGKKKAMFDIGMENQYIDTHKKNGVKISSHDKDTDKILRQEGIYNMGIMESFINIIDKNKELWHKDK